jgi:DNA-binding NtrC family response regulator
MTTHGGILVVEDDTEMRELLREELVDAGYPVLAASDGAEAMEMLGTRPVGVDVVVTDLIMPGVRGDDLLEWLREHHPHTPVIILTAFGSIESAVEMVKAGAYDYLAKPFRIEQLLGTVERAIKEGEFRDLKQQAGSRTGHWAGIVAVHPSMRRAVELTMRAAASDAPVLLRGESGTGKELFARALHDESRRREGPFVAVNCSAIPETLLEGQLFGYRRGAFTDAREDRRGLIQEADGGTLFLDEIGDMPAAAQGKLLRVLQEREVHPLGAPAPVPVDVRIVAATHRDLESLVRQSCFRQDLYYRLNVIEIPIPPLRERPEDFVPLVAHLLDKHAPRLGRTGATLSNEAMDLLRSYAWPGNARELENVVERSLVLGRDAVIGVRDLPERLRELASPRKSEPDPSSRPLSDVEREHILNTLRATKGNKAAAARILGLDRKTLYRKLESYGGGRSGS